MTDAKVYQPTPCDSCPRPGACCRLFALSARFWDDEPIEAQWANYSDHYPFVPVRKMAGRSGYRDEQSGRTYSLWQFNCPKLGPDGRCTIYEERPNTCRVFEPATDPLCVLFVGPPSIDPEVARI